VPLALPSARGRSNSADCNRFTVGDRVKVRTEHVAGHVRMPASIRGKQGIVVGESPAYPFPDAHAHGIVADDEPTYDVRFDTADLWSDSADQAFVHVAVFQSYLGIVE
jgi:nitrile hydratase subunit beta